MQVLQYYILIHELLILRPEFVIGTTVWQ